MRLTIVEANLQPVRFPLVEQAAIQSGLAFFYTLTGMVTGSGVLGVPVSWLGVLVACGASAGLAFFVKMSIGTGGSNTPITPKVLPSP